MLSSYPWRIISVFHYFVVAVLASLALFTTTFAFGAIGPLSTTRPYHYQSLEKSSSSRMGSSQSSQSSSEPTLSAESIIDGSASVTDNDGVNDDQLLHHVSNRQQLVLAYEPPNSPVNPIAHFIFLVHGWLGNDLEMDYLSRAIRGLTSKDDDENDNNSSDSADSPEDHSKRIRKSNSYESRLLASQYNNMSNDTTDQHKDKVVVPDIIIHSVKCNVGRTHDGIRKGGTRLANEIIEFIRSDIKQRQNQSLVGSDDESSDDSKQNEDSHVTYSVVGNSLGGLYARYALSQIPYRIPLPVLQQQHQQHTEKTSRMLHLHPNVFCTTATPHLGVSRHTYLPIPRIAEKLIGKGMGTTGRDLFRLNSEKEQTSSVATAGNIMSGGLKGSTDDGDVNGNGDGIEGAEQPMSSEDDEEMECIIRNMCLQDKYLSPLRNFRRRIAYANAYGTDFQVPTATAAFLNERSGVGHVLVASRELPNTAHGEGEQQGTTSSNESDQEDGVLPPFIVAVVRTEKQSQRQSPSNSGGGDTAIPSDELLRMSQSLDALGWTKVFVDVRDQIPIPGLARPSWLRPRCESLDDLIRKRIGVELPSTNFDERPTASSKRKAGDDISKSHPTTANTNTDCILSSQDLAQSTNVADSFHFPMGHTVMIANSKNEKYSQWNSLGRPVMDSLAEDMVKNILEFK
ncbi:hypothetical protein ACHAWU_000270 [Discostella pseudostelligera]|uniref:DUF676 domain-containing protein n=1 Tax=Discostella pseudostelligera TaxID=259834 RepID=A0ABD3MKZ5_9STRA